MKDKILNWLMLSAVAAALLLTLARGAPPSPDAGFSSAFRAVPAPSPSPEPDPAAAYLARREESRKQEKDALLRLCESPGTGRSMQALAEEQLRELVKNAEIELAVEAALAARGRSRALCVSRKGEVLVLLAEEIPPEEAALLLEIAQRASGLPAEKIRLSGCSF